MKIVPNDIFFAEVERCVKNGEIVKIPMKGYSMFPFLRNEGDKITLSPISVVKKGDVLLFKYKNRCVLHRLIAIDGDRLHFKGDGNIDKGEFVNRCDVIAKLISVERGDKAVILCSSFKWRFYSQLWHILSPFRRYLLAILRRIKA